MPLIGQPFDPWLVKQIDYRQQILGVFNNRNNEVLKYYTLRTPWLRVASSIKLLEKVPQFKVTLDTTGSIVNKTPIEPLDNPTYKRLLGLGYNKEFLDNAAQNFILQGGAINDSFAIAGGLYNDTNNIPGFNYTRSNPKFSAYGWGGNTGPGSKGFVPLPGVTDASIEYLNNGSITKTTINIKCWNRRQFALIDALYLRPGYSLLLEFGWNMYLNKNGELTQFDLTPKTFTNFITQVPEGTAGSQEKQYALFKSMKEDRETYCGNYEAVIGLISNFSWNFNPDGSYNCQVSLTGMGDVIESLKVNTVASKKEGTENPSTNISVFPPGAIVIKDSTVTAATSNENTKDEKGNNKKVKTPDAKSLADAKAKSKNTKPEETNPNPVVANKDKTELHRILYDIYNETQIASGLTVEKNSGKDIQVLDIHLPIPIPYEYEEDGKKIPPFTPKDKTITGGILRVPGVTVQDGDGKNQKFTAPQVYITFGTLLGILQYHFVPGHKTDQNNSSDKSQTFPMFYFDVNFGDLQKDNTYMLHVPGRFSADPRICLIPYEAPVFKDVQDKIKIPDTKLNNALKRDDAAKFIVGEVDGNPYVGRLCNIYININIISHLLTSSQPDEDGGISVLSLLQGILDKVNTSLGSINDIQIFSGQDGKISFFDNAPYPKDNLDNKTKPSDDKISGPRYARINLYGGGQFLESPPVEGSNDYSPYLDLTNSKVSQNNSNYSLQGSFVKNINLSAAIPKNMSSMIAIGAQAGGTSGATTGFSSYNTGLIDRVLPTKVFLPHPDDATEKVDIVENFKKLLDTRKQQ